MNPTDWFVIAAGGALISWVCWYFFLAQRTAVVATSNAASTVPEVPITVKGGYEPSVIRVKAGQTVRLVFDRQETSSCSEEVVFPDFGLRRFLPAFQKTAIDVTPPRSGKYGFTCGMSMLHGSLIAE